MNINQLAAFAVIARNGGAHTISPASMEVVPSLINNEYITERPEDHETPGYDLTPKGKKLAALLVSASEYFEAHQEVKKGASEFVESVSNETDRLIEEGKKTFNRFLDSIKFQ